MKLRQRDRKLRDKESGLQESAQESYVDKDRAIVVNAGKMRGIQYLRKQEEVGGWSTKCLHLFM